MRGFRLWQGESPHNISVLNGRDRILPNPDHCSSNFLPQLLIAEIYEEFSLRIFCIFNLHSGYFQKQFKQKISENSAMLLLLVSSYSSCPDS